MIIARLRGGLGNQMFEYAAGRARAIAAGEPLALDREWFDSAGALSPRRAYDLGVFAMEPRRATRIQIVVAKLFGRYVDGFFQSERYFRAVAERIRADFAFRDHILPGSQELARSIGATDSVCVHVRRTDFVTGGIFVGAVYYERASAEMLRRFPDASFFVFSDDLEWCRANLSFLPRVAFVGQEHAGLSYGNYLQLMSLCHHFIIPNSTFSWWAAWLGARAGKTVIAASGWSHGDDEATPPEWLRM